MIFRNEPQKLPIDEDNREIYRNIFNADRPLCQQKDDYHSLTKVIRITSDGLRNRKFSSAPNKGICIK